MKKVFLLSIIPIIISSCASYKKYSYEPIDSLKTLDGIYHDSTKHIVNSFNLYENDSIDIFKLNFIDNKYLQISGLTDNGYEILKTYKGKYNNKENYLQITLSKIYAPFLAVHIMRRDAVRIGKSKDNTLFVDKQYYGYGGMIFYYGGYDYQSSEHLSPISDLSIIPTQQNKKWGFADKDGNIIINAKYDFVRTFTGNVARIKLENKWGLIDKNGKEIVIPQYDKIKPTYDNDSIFYIYKGKKYGIMDINGKELVPPLFDNVSPYNYESKFSNKTHFKVIRGKKMGIYNNGNEIVPVIADFISQGSEQIEIDYSKIDADLLGYTISIKRKKYLIDSEKRLYEIKKNKQKFLEAFLEKSPTYYLEQPISYEVLLEN